MKKIDDLIEWIWSSSDKEILSKDIKRKFKLTDDELRDILKILIQERIIIEIYEDRFFLSEKAQILEKKTKERLKELTPLLEKTLTSKENIQATEISNLNDWDDIYEINKFVIFQGEERIYEIHIKNKVIRMEGKEIIDYNVFILKFWEEFGIMLPKYKGIGNDWAKLLGYWYNKYGEISKDKAEFLSPSLEAKELIIDYVNNATISDDYIIKEGIITYRNNSLFVPTKIIKKLLKRNDLNLSMRKLSYVLKDYLISGSIPLKIENKSERFWNFDVSKFEVNLDNKLNIQKEEDNDKSDEE